MNLLICPVKGCDLKGPPIPEQYLNLYGGARYYSRVLSHYSREKDRTTSFLCPDCGATWDAK